MYFTWDKNKAKKVKANHKVDFGKLKDIFVDPFAIEFVDEEHSTDDEIRFEIIGQSVEYGLVYLVFTETTETKLHFITARKAENLVVKQYDENRSRN